jgi:ppGpp synthetase/RelA/SpoT-type nucleotidyltranferase
MSAASSHLTPEEAAFHAYYARERAALEQTCAARVALLQSLLSKARHIDIAKVEGRVKDRDECIRKFSRKYRAALEESGAPYEIQDCITDLIGVRVVCLYEDELEKVAQIVRSHFDVIDVTDKVSALEGTESSFGYKGLHLDLRTRPAQPRDGAPHAHLPFELQVRTIVQDSWSVLDHKIKYKKSIPAELKRRINVLAALFELADREFRQIRDATDAELLGAPDETAEPETDTARAPAPGCELNAFTFLKIARHFFIDQEFDAHKVDLPGRPASRGPASTRCCASPSARSSDTSSSTRRKTPRAASTRIP